MSIERYSIIGKKNPREIVLLKSKPCQWGLCRFCDYIYDNHHDQNENAIFNKHVMNRVTGNYKQLEIINSGSCMELPSETLTDIESIVTAKNIQKLYFEAHYRYKDELESFSKKFNVPVIFKTGIETFDDVFRNKVLRKGVYFSSPEEVASYFQSICLMVGIKGQTKEMIRNDITILKRHFKHGCINIYQNNTTDIKEDPDLVEWFKEEFSYLEADESIDILWHNTDFGVGGELHG